MDRQLRDLWYQRHDETDPRTSSRKSCFIFIDTTPSRMKDTQPALQHECNRISAQLNARPRKRLGYRTPEKYYGR